jgi:hypothetical protein
MSEGGGLRRRGAARDADGSAPRAPRKKFTLASMDLYAKVEEEDRVKTSTGASLSLLSLAAMCLLVLSELRGWLSLVRSEHVTVDSVVEARVRVNFDITLHALPCDQVNLDAMDVAGEQQNGVDHSFLKTRLDPSGKPIAAPMAGAIEEREGGAPPLAALAGPAGAGAPPLPPDYCGPCYGAEREAGACCNTCDAVRAAYTAKGWDAGEVTRTSEQCAREGRAHEGGAHRLALGPGPGLKEGCRLAGFMLVNKVAGNFHIAMGETHTRGAGHIHQFNPANIANYNVSHTIHGLSFGEPFPGQINPLDGAIHVPQEGAAVYMYYVKVVPTTFKAGTSRALSTFQYSVSSQFRPAVLHGVRQNVLPGLFFVYELAPFLVTVTEARGAFLHFVTGLCAILGGVITLARLSDTILHAAARALKWGVGEAAVASASAAAASFVKTVAVKGAAAAAAAVASPGAAGGGGGGGTGGGGAGGGGGGGGGLALHSDTLSPTSVHGGGRHAPPARSASEKSA